MTIRLGANPIIWSNDDLRELGGDTPLETCLGEAREIGFEGMELAITQAAEAACAADPVRAAAEKAAAAAALSRRTIPAACAAFGAGALSLAVAVAVQPQAGGWLVHFVATLLRILNRPAGVANLRGRADTRDFRWE